MPDAVLVEAIRAILSDSPFHGEGHRKLWARLRMAGVRTSKRRVLRLMYASDYPHSECQFPNSIDNILAWQSLNSQTQQKLFWDNANRFYRQT
jgi:predicted TIM-barrel fold metal-dependent hydrolase